MATYYRTGVETYSIIGTADERDSLEGRIPDGSTYFAVDENMFYTFYDGTWYETLPEAARLYHDDVGTDTKPIKLVGGVATAVANELAEDSKVVHLAGTETITGTKNFTGFITNVTNQSWNNIEIGSRSLANYIRARKYDSSGKNDTNFLIGTTYSDASNVYARFTVYAPREVFGDESETQCSYGVAVRSGKDGSGRFYASLGDANGGTTELTLVSYVPGTGYRCDASTYTADTSADTRVVNRAMLAQTPTVVHTTGNESIAGTKTFNKIVAPMLHPMTYDYFSTRDKYVVARCNKSVEGYIVVTLSNTAGAECRVQLYEGTESNLANVIYASGCSGMEFGIIDDPDSNYAVVTVKTPSSRNHVMTFEAYNRFGNPVGGFEVLTTHTVFSPSTTPAKSAEVVIP